MVLTIDSADSYDSTREEVYNTDGVAERSWLKVAVPKLHYTYNIYIYITYINNKFLI